MTKCFSLLPIQEFELLFDFSNAPHDKRMSRCLNSDGDK